MMSELTLEKQRLRSGIPLPPGAKLHRRPPVDRPSGGILQPVGPPKPVRDDDVETQPVDDAAAKKRELKITPRQRLERMISDMPTVLENYFELADLLIAEHKHLDAERTLARALHASGGDPKVRLRLEDAQMQRARHELGLEERKARKEKTERAFELVKGMRDAVNRLELEIYGARAERFPQDLDVKFELAMRLKRAGNYAEALKHFDLAREAPQHKAMSLLEAGECLQHLKSFEKALKCYSKAADTADDEECRKLALYRGGVLATGMKRLDDAGQLLQRLAKLDPHYKDIEDRLDKIGRIRDKG
jgi:tetratricopeptide (TPR) repeat protein